MIGALIGAGLGAATSLYGMYQASQAAKKANEMENANYMKQSEENQNWFDRRYNEDATQRADAQRVLTITQDAIRQRNKAAAGANAVSGGTEESLAETKAANAQAVADATSKIAVAGEARKDNIEEQYRQRKAQLDDSHTRYGVGIEQQRAQNIVNAANGAGNAVGTLGSAVDELLALNNK